MTKYILLGLLILSACAPLQAGVDVQTQTCVAALVDSHRRGQHDMIAVAAVNPDCNRLAQEAVQLAIRLALIAL